MCYAIDLRGYCRNGKGIGEGIRKLKQGVKDMPYDEPESPGVDDEAPRKESPVRAGVLTPLMGKSCKLFAC